MLALGGTQPLDLEQRMEERFAQMNARIGELEQRNDRLETENDHLRQAPGGFHVVAASGEVKGRRTSAYPNECCRWTPDDTCTAVTPARLQACTFFHEYLETKTTTHSFDDITDCFGADESNWRTEFNGVTGSVTLKNGATAQSTFPTPLKVTHSAACAEGVQPTLDLQLDTTAGVLNVAGSLSLQGVDLTAKLLELAAYPLPKYERHTNWACPGQNDFMSHTEKTFAECQALCDAGATCASFEYRWSDSRCSGSLTTDACTGADGGQDSSGFTCVPTPSHVPARVRCPRSFRLRSHAPGPLADARALPFARADANTCRPPDSRREQKFAISR